MFSGSDVVRSLGSSPPSGEKRYLTIPQHSHLVLTQLNIQRHYGVFCDVVLRIDKYDFKAHKCVLAAGCPKLQTMLYSIRSECGIDILALKDLPINGFKYILEFLYTGTLEIKDAHLHEIVSAAQYLEVRDVEKACMDYQYNKTTPHTIAPSDNMGRATAPPHYTYPPSHIAKTNQAAMYHTPNVNLDNSCIEDYLQCIEPTGGVGPALYAGYSSPRLPPHQTNSSSCAMTPKVTYMCIASQTDACEWADKCTNTDIDITGLGGRTVDSTPKAKQKRKTATPTKVAQGNEEDNYDVEMMQMLQEDEEEVEEEEEEYLPVKRKRGRPRKCEIRSKVRQMTTKVNEEDEVAVVKRKRGRPKKGEERPRAERLAKKRKVGIRGTLAKLRRTCPKCGRMFARRKALEKHMQLHDTDQLYSCDMCNMKFPRSAELTRHMRQHNKQTFKCRFCQSEYEDPKQFKKHVHDMHDDPRPFHCVYDGCQFTGEKLSDLTRHIPIHSGQKAFVCHKCGKAFAQSNGLWHHRRSCIKPNSYICEVCGSRFNHLQTLKGHRLVHSGEKPYLCKDCGARFRDRNNYRRHLQIHDKTFPYPCVQCDKRFRHTNSLKVHMRQHDPQLAAQYSAKKHHTQQQQQQQQPVIVQEVISSDQGLPLPSHVHPHLLHVPQLPAQTASQQAHHGASLTQMVQHPTQLHTHTHPATCHPPVLPTSHTPHSALPTSLQGPLPSSLHHPNMLQNPQLFTPVPMMPHLNQYGFPSIDMRNCPPPPGM